MAGEGTLTIRVVTPEGALFKGTGSFVAVPAKTGEVGIKPMHTALIARLGTGILRVLEEGLGKAITERFAVRGGFLQVIDNEVTLLVAQAATADDVDKDALKTEREELLVKLQHPESDDNYDELLADRQWLEAREKELLDVAYFHVVFTLPADLGLGHGPHLGDQRGFGSDAKIFIQGPGCSVIAEKPK